MNWTLAIDLNRKALLRIVAGLVVMMGAGGEGGDALLPKRVYLVILSILRPAESAVRRLIAVAAQGVAVPAGVARGASKAGVSQGVAQRKPLFQLFDTRLRVGLHPSPPVVTTGPNIRVFGVEDDGVYGRDDPPPDGPVSAVRLTQRVEAMRAALDQMPEQAVRLARAMAWPKQRYGLPMRPGRPPGFRARPRHEIDDILAECHALARYALSPPDTS